MRLDPVTGESRQSTWWDVGVFALTLVLGIGAYVGIRIWLGKSSQLPVTATLVGLMVLYAAAVVGVSRLRIRMDQAGDNAYYLGLLFTLASMAFALYDFGTATRTQASATGVQEIISNFGIALATTIAGIFLRVLLHQMRVDPADLEATTRIELTEAASRVRDTMNTVTTDLSRFHLEVMQRSTDATSELMAGLTTAAGKLVTSTETAQTETLNRTRDLTQLITGLATEAARAVDRLRTVEPPTLTLSRRLDKVAAVLETVATHSERTTNALSGTSEATARAVLAVARTTEMLDRQVARMKEEHAKLTDQLAGAATGLTAALAPFSSRLKEVLDQLTQLEEHSKQSAEGSVKAQQAATEVLAHLTKLVRGLTDILNRPDHSRHA